MSTQGPIFQGPEFRAPEIRPRQTGLEKFVAGLVSLSPQVKAALITFVSTCAVAAFYSIVQCSHVSGENAILKHDNQNLAGKVREQETAILKLSTEKASAENRAATWETVPLRVPSIISNLDNILATEPTNQQQLLSLLYSVEALTNALAEATLRPTFDLIINGSKITNGTVLDLKQSRVLKIRVKCTSPVTVEQLSVDFMAPLGLDPTNLVANGWSIQPIGVVSDGRRMDIPFANRWVWHADQLINSQINYHVASLQISTNCPWPVMSVQFEVYAARSKTAIFPVTLTF